jgi:hypothetical protein
MNDQVDYSHEALGEVIHGQIGGAVEIIDKVIDEFPEKVRPRMYYAMVNEVVGMQVDMLMAHFNNNISHALATTKEIQASMVKKMWPKEIIDYIIGKMESRIWDKVIGGKTDETDN